MKALPCPKLHWHEDGTPSSSAFDDIYYAPGEGLAESRHVFLDGNELPQSWESAETFTIFETGFGTGLNFLALWQLWRRGRKPGQQLHFVSVEGFPLAKEDLLRALRPFAEVADLAEKLASVYPPRIAGYHRLNFPEDGLTLTLIFGEAEEVLPMFEGRVDAWFLDGFAPSRNPQMWSEALFKAMARCSSPGTRAATFTVAGAIRRGLEGAGFVLERRPGFGRKRECLSAQFATWPRQSLRKPWFASPQRQSRFSKVAVIGAGIAGAATAHVLSREGIDVTVFDKAKDVAADASGNPVGLVNPGFSLSDDPIARFREGACLHANGFYNQLGLPSGVWRHTGVMQVAAGTAASEKQARLTKMMGSDNPWFETLSADEALRRLGVGADRPALYVRQAGLVAPRAVCEHLLSAVSLRLGVAVGHLVRAADGWDLLTPMGEPLGRFDAVIIANAFASRSFAETSWLPLVRNRGQITILPQNAGLPDLKCPASFGGYLAPPLGEMEAAGVLGATYREVDGGAEPDLTLSDADHQENLAALQNGLGLSPILDINELAGRVSLRVRTPDRLPVVGPVPVAETYRRAYATVRHGNRFEHFPAADYHDGLYLSVGYGSRGFQWAPLAAEIIAAELLGYPPPVSRDVMEILHPARFILRDLRRA
ncbi:MAG: bifunctional tRNA (5-methylaminomethyl-2-thiouridine)(34)-methyltransferase MnmD/FAD-dependent 5-carboxymethylaminomethyl-2-thiouridine(34) oxidoreductase MnmC [Alphaproteobacteria bacterium]|nr:MAG: bifunctional tRNA (5-methylaminomethyl-2-thiouridine)(34)-methyltransferase MnmD/FAD-dependent 5-carboxymethylaminomethyl-2-thiouridine(34) oxidoreductase MnmC [Alphaproteobacteria bacterium]